MNHPIARTIAETVEASGIGRTKLYEAIKNGDLAARKLGRRTLILDDDLREWLEQLPPLTPSDRGAGQ